jgi:predicted nucleotidyltransferase
MEPVIEEYESLIVELKKICQQVGIDFFLMGAQARDLLFNHYEINTKNIRRTRDIDFGVKISLVDHFDELSEKIKQHSDFSERKNEYCFLYKEKIEVDLLPFGEIKGNDGIKYLGAYFSKISTEGFEQAFASAKKMDLSQYPAETINVCALEGLFLLKLLAWDDRPEHRGKDAKDISWLLVSAHQMLASEYEDEWFTETEGYWEEYNYDSEIVGARMLGKKVAGIVSDNQSLYNRVTRILSREINDQTPTPLNKEMHINHNDLDWEKINKLLKALLKGLGEKK